jgi:hypothetical protein
MRRAPAHIHRVRAGRRSRGVTTPVSFVYLPVSLTGPGPSGSPEPTRLCRGCSHPHQRLPARAASSFTPPLRQQGDGGLTPPSGTPAPRGARPSRLRSTFGTSSSSVTIDVQRRQCAASDRKMTLTRDGLVCVVVLVWLGGGLQDDGLAEGFELGYQVSDLAAFVDTCEVVVGAEVGEAFGGVGQ